ncbi:TIGR04326 family surface carbohydrate biosynthesis protein [Cylindrospermopsis raciborskii]|uniref:TIGR04326 family surface carbohydrate biosynthesis protein n=1 Tax=Cylindrospermopsis raciborskii TaxID=77022 RepID=UPI0015E124C0|nr:TIGR04326 family surface carbohydrate biosynthesis protein [Cylindrospermopsis raciborskii]
MSTILIWDHPDIPPVSLAAGKNIIFWCSYSTHGFQSAVSIPQWVEDHADSLRQRYLAWVYEIGETQIQGQRVVDHLQLRPGFSAWWMSLLAEKCNFVKSTHIDDAIKLIAFIDWLDVSSATSMLLVSPKKDLAKCLESWSQLNGIRFLWQTTLLTASSPWSWRRFFRRLPLPFQAMIWLVHHTSSRWTFRRIGKQSWKNTVGQITFISYLFNLDSEAAAQGVFQDRYWGSLPHYLRNAGIATNWLHLYIPSDLLPNPSVAIMQIKRFNQIDEGEVHITADTFLSPVVIIKTLQDWWRIAERGQRLSLHRHCPKLGTLNIWPLFQHDWEKSILGITSLSNCLYINLFESAFQTLPLQRTGIYLQENMDWEFAAIHAWQANHHGLLVGCPHTTVRFWDLRYFFDQRTYCSTELNPIPRPDQVALNGPLAQKAFLKGGYPGEQLVGVEALRFMHLINSSGFSTCLKPKESNLLTTSAHHPRLLVMGDYTQTYTHHQMRLLCDAVTNLSEELEIMVKPHPAQPIHPEEYPRIAFTLFTEPLADLFPYADIVYAGAMTSAGLEAHCYGLPVIAVLDGRTLNVSPLRDIEGTFFVSTSAELAEAIQEAIDFPKEDIPANRFFYLDKSFSRWGKILIP